MHLFVKGNPSIFCSGENNYVKRLCNSFLLTGGIIKS